MLNRYFALVFILGAIFTFTSHASADLIYVLGNGHSSINNAVNNLNDLGHSVTNSNTALSDYSAYDQVWDLRYSSDLPVAQRTAFSDYLANGGSLYMSGENGVFDFNRNNHINLFLSEIGAGPVSLTSNTNGFENQEITLAGQVVNDPNPMATVSTYFARRVVAPGSGFLVTESASNPGTGSLVGWDFGDLSNHPNARLLVGFDIELFDNGVGWTDNVSTFLGGSAIPEPGGFWLCAGAVVPLVLRRRRSKLAARSGSSFKTIPGRLISR